MRILMFVAFFVLSGNCYGSGNICADVFLKKQAPQLYLDSSMAAGEINAAILSHTKAYETDLSLYDLVYLIRAIKKTGTPQATSQFFRHVSDYTATLVLMESVIQNHSNLSPRDFAYLLEQIKNDQAREELKQKYQLN